MKLTSLSLLTAGFLAVGATAARADDRITLQFATGVDYARGSFGSQKTFQAYLVPITGRISWKDWTLRLTVPYINSETILGIQTLTDLGSEDTTGFLGLPAGPPRFQKLRWTRGFGDATLGVTKKFNRIMHSPAYFDTVIKMRLPTGQSARGFGIAGTDVFMNGEFGGDWAWGGLYADAGYRILADTPVFVRHDGFQAGFGGWANLTHRDQLGGYFEWHQHSLTRDPDFGLIGGCPSSEHLAQLAA